MRTIVPKTLRLQLLGLGGLALLALVLSARLAALPLVPVPTLTPQRHSPTPLLETTFSFPPTPVPNVDLVAYPPPPTAYPLPTALAPALLPTTAPNAQHPAPPPSVGAYAWPWQPLVPAYADATFIGATHWRVDLAAPAGRGGLRPNLALLYNSADMDELRGAVNPQTPSVGAGWRLNLPYIERVWAANAALGLPQVAAHETGQYRLVWEGQSEPLVCVEPKAEGCTEFRTQAERFWRVVRATDAPLPLGWADTPLAREYWWVMLPDGTRYRLGYARGAEDNASAWFMYAQVPDAQNALEPVIWRWNVDWMEDRHGNAVAYGYAPERRELRVCVEATCWATPGAREATDTVLPAGPYVRGGTLAEVRWSVGFAELDTPYRLLVSVAEEPGFAPEDAEAYTSLAFYTQAVYKAFTVQMAGPGGWVPLRTYALTNAIDKQGFLVLKAVQVWGMGGQRLPAQTFGYADYAGYRLASCAGQAQGYKPYLTAAERPTGGRVQFVYTAPQFRVGPMLAQAGAVCDPVGEVMAEGERRFWLRHRVREEVTWLGDATPPRITVYEYRTPTGQIAFGDWLTETQRTFRGHAVVRVYHAAGQVFDGGGRPLAATLASWEDLAFYQGLANLAPRLSCGGALAADGVGLQGQRYAQQSYAATGQLLLSRVTRWGVHATAQNAAHSATLPGARCTVWGTGSASVRVEYSYHLAYGYVNEQRDYASAAALTPYRTTTTFNRVNAARWLVGLPELVAVWAGDNDAGALVQQTAYYYDRDAAGEVRPWASAPITGDVVRVDTPLLSGSVPVQGVWHDTWYDGYGNVIQRRDALGYTTTLAYDVQFQQFAVRVCNYLAQCAQAAYYGVAGEGRHGGGLGQVARTWDVNAVMTRYVYDGLGRLVGEVRPNARVSALPLSETFYAGPILKEAIGSEAALRGPLRPAARPAFMYDVLDRVTQVVDALGQTTVITYDTLGRVVGRQGPNGEQWAYTYDLNGNLRTQTDAQGQTLWWGYDGLNRVVAQRATDVNGPLLATYGYDMGAFGVGRRVLMTDAVGTKTWAYDAQGRVVQVRQQVRGVGDFVWGYAYDAASRVTQIVYPTGEVVTYTYDADAAGALVSVRGWALYANGQRAEGQSAFQAPPSGAGEWRLIVAPNGDRTLYLENLLEVFLPAQSQGPLPSGPYTLHLPLVWRGAWSPAGWATIKTYYYAGSALVAVRAAHGTSSTVQYRPGDDR